MKIRDDASTPETAADPVRHSTRSLFKSRRARIVVCCTIGIVTATILCSHFKPWLSANERRMLGIWTWKDTAGKMVIQYRTDRTLRYTYASPTGRRVIFMRWWFDGDTLCYEHSGRDTLVTAVNKHVLRVKYSGDRTPVVFNADGSVTHKLPDGSRKHAIPWQSKFLNEAP